MRHLILQVESVEPPAFIEHDTSGDVLLVILGDVMTTRSIPVLQISIAKYGKELALVELHLSGIFATCHGSH